MVIKQPSVGAAMWLFVFFVSSSRCRGLVCKCGISWSNLLCFRSPEHKAFALFVQRDSSVKQYLLLNHWPKCTFISIRRHSKSLFTIDERRSKIARNSVFECQLCDKRQSKTLFMTIFYLSSSIVLTFLIAAYPVCDKSLF